MATKTCSKCKEEKSLDQYSRKGVRKDGTQKYQPYCKPCQSTKIKEYYASNKEYHKKQIKKRTGWYRKETHSALLKYFNEHPCMDCGNSDVRVLEFDHVRGVKSDNVSSLVQRRMSWGVIQREIDKCEVVCANCHRIRTLMRQKTYRTNTT